MLKRRGVQYIFCGVLVFVLLPGCKLLKPTGESKSTISTIEKPSTVSTTGKPSTVEGVRITSVEPSHGARGATVIINGSGFSEDPSQNVVQFGTTRAAVKNSGSKVIVAEVPPSIIDGKYNLAVTNTKTNQTSSNVEFMVHAGPVAATTGPETHAGASHSGSPTRAPAKPPAGATAPASKTTGPTTADRVEPLTVPAGTKLAVRLVDGLSSGKNKVGDQVELTLDQPLVVGGQTLARKGSTVMGRVTQAKGSGRVKGRGLLGFTLVSLRPVGTNQSYAIQTNQITKEAPGTKKRDAEIIGGGAGIGAAIGAIAGGKKGAAIGAAVGAGSGTGTVVAIKGKEVEYPPETPFTFTLRAPLTLTK